MEQLSSHSGSKMVDKRAMKKDKNLNLYKNNNSKYMHQQEHVELRTSFCSLA